MTACLAAEPVIVIWLGAGGPERAASMIADLRTRHATSRLILLTTREAAGQVRGLADEVWADGATRGAAAFLARARRLSWASPAVVYDLEGSRATVRLRFCVWPRPQWRLVVPGQEIQPLS